MTTPNSPSNTPDVPFVIVTMARSGSTHLVYLLDQHPDVRCFGEPLATGANGGWCATDDELITAFTGAAATHCVGYKLLGEQLVGRPRTLPKLERVPNIRFIVLQRRNQLERIRSMRQAETTNLWQWGTEAPPPQPPAVRLEPEDCIQQLADADRWYQQCARLTPAVWLYYEDLCEDQDAALRPVWELLDVPAPESLAPVTVKLESRPLSDSISNWPELVQAFRDSPCASHYWEPQWM